MLNVTDLDVKLICTCFVSVHVSQPGFKPSTSGLHQDMRKSNMLSTVLHGLEQPIYEPPHDKTNKMTVCPAKTQISLGIRPVWSESLLCAQWVAKDPSFLHLHADSEDSDQTGWLPRLIWIFTGHTRHFVGFVMRWLIETLKNTTIYIDYFLQILWLT